MHGKHFSRKPNWTFITSAVIVHILVHNCTVSIFSFCGPSSPTLAVCDLSVGVPAAFLACGSSGQSLQRQRVHKRDRWRNVVSVCCLLETLSDSAYMVDSKGRGGGGGGGGGGGIQGGTLRTLNQEHASLSTTKVNPWQCLVSFRFMVTPGGRSSDAQWTLDVAGGGGGRARGRGERRGRVGTSRVGSRRSFVR